VRKRYVRLAHKMTPSLESFGWLVISLFNGIVSGMSFIYYFTVFCVGFP
jgi:hypothetical protein